MIEINDEQIKKDWITSIEEIKVSICCIAYNQELYISETIDSFLKQKTNFPFEILVSDDCSTDATKEIIEQYVHKFPGIIKSVGVAKNLGANGNIMNVLSHAKGNYIAFCEGDDYWIDDNKLQVQLEAMESNPHIKFSFHPCYLLNNNVLNESRSFYKGPNPTVFHIKDVLNSLNQFAPTASYMFHRSLIDTIPDWFINAPVGDLFLELYGMKSSGGLYIPDINSVYRLASLGSWSTETQKETTTHKNRHLKLIEFLSLAQKDFSEYSNAFSRKKAYIFLSLATRAVKVGNYQDFNKYLKAANEHYKQLDFRHKFFNYMHKLPLVIRLFIKMKNKLSHYK
ncbi:glycosyltransferase [Enterobacter sp. RHBSTW-01064]|uniref:glycosyltransferase n=1 Tax=Enterobacter sp. RHBSTW-01064 TaxID=2742679 RepID=UPI0015F8ABC5|nr:glycosyltransferase [Enterobacter sp. RHBSTW-01064]MBA7751026.1 glycosyltransferase [Enterobacter sp. RHBSTW-01064]